MLIPTSKYIGWKFYEEWNILSSFKVPLYKTLIKYKEEKDNFTVEKLADTTLID